MLNLIINVPYDTGVILLYSKTSLLRPPLVPSQSGLNSEVVWLLRFDFQLVWIFISELGFDTNWYALCVFKYITCLLYAFHYVILFLLFNENIEKQTQLQCIIGQNNFYCAKVNYNCTVPHQEVEFFSFSLITRVAFIPL